ncbi:hypothetical protein AMECASPLE_016824 [Ameca splendens]|uniref:Uncharacterized protein n=1 Tax=Ameca splendens TaxID=208324 RepID=A0ABV1ABW7_9TELE
MWVRSLTKTMTEYSGQQDPAEALKRTLSEHSSQILPHDSSLRSLAEQQRQTNVQPEQIALMLQHTLISQISTTAEGAKASPVSQQLPHLRDVTSPNPVKYSGEADQAPRMPNLTPYPDNSPRMILRKNLHPFCLPIGLLVHLHGKKRISSPELNVMSPTLELGPRTELLCLRLFVHA